MVKWTVIILMIFGLWLTYTKSVEAECLWPNVGRTCLVCHKEERQKCEFGVYGLDCMICHQYMSVIDEKTKSKKDKKYKK